MSLEGQTKHVVGFVLPSWGHNKPLVAFFAKLVRLAPVHVSLFTGISIYDRVVREVDKQFLPEGEEPLKDLIRVISLPGAKIPSKREDYQEAFAEKYKLLCERKPIPATPEGTVVHSAVSPPQVVLLDFFLYESMAIIRSISGPNVPIYAWQSGSTCAVIYRYGPEYLGGLGDFAKKIEALNVNDEEDRKEKAHELFRRTKGDLLNLPGLPPMYDYELKPQKMIVPVDIIKHCQYVHRMLLESDGSIHCTNRIYEGPSLDAWAEWRKGKPVFAIGPIETPRNLIKTHGTKDPSDIEIEVRAFLDNAYREHGKESVFYIAFGTIFWPTEPEKIWTVLDVLIELKIPFLFAHASPFAIVPEDVKRKVAESGLGFMSNWLPQELILNHEACGWFISHGGQNSTMESLTAGVPIIFWPFESDQPTNAALVSMVHNAGYELLEVRQDVALQPMYRLEGKAPSGTVEALRKEAMDMFKKAKGDEGKLCRSIARKLGKQFAELWEEDGLGWKELQGFADVSKLR